MGAIEAGTHDAADLDAPSRARRAARACAGPALIVAGVLFALRGFVFADRLSDGHPDILTFWLPRFSFLGRSIAAGHVPLWNPFEMAGYRYAADPQSGWLYLLPMGLFSQLAPAVAMRAFIVVNPIVAGLGLFSFLRLERLSRVAATAGGLSIAMLISTSEIAISMPFAGAMAWSCVALASAAAYRRASAWPARLGSIAIAGLAWSQVAAAHLSHGLVVCTVLIVAYLTAGAVADISGSRARTLVAAGRVLAFVAALPLLSLAVVLPRIAAIQASSLAAGYERLGDALGTLGGSDGGSLQTNGVWAAWPLAFGSAPGAYAGATILLGALLAVRARRRRALTWAFGGTLVIAWALMLDVVVSTPWVREIFLRVPFGDVYLHNPGRMRYLAVIAVPVLGAVGIQGLLDEPLTPRSARRWLTAGGLLWLGVPLAALANPLYFVLLALGLAGGWLALSRLATGASSRTTGTVVVAVLAVELAVSAVVSQLTPVGHTVELNLEAGAHPNLVPQPLALPRVDASAFTTPTAFVPRLTATHDRYLTWAPPASSFEKGYLFMQLEPDWPALAMERGTLFGVHDALGYNPVQLPRYWSFIRARTPLPVFYNAAVVDLPTPRDIRLLGVRYLVVPTGVPPPLDGSVVERTGGYDLVELDDRQPRASVVTDFHIVEAAGDAVRAIMSPAFDPARLAVLEGDPGIEPAAGAGSGVATYSETSPEYVTIDVTATAPAIVVVRTSFDEGWGATVDGRAATVVPVDGFLQGVVVTAGTHRIEMTYRDDAVTRGVQLGIAAWLLLAVSWGAALVNGRRRARSRATAGLPRGAAGR